ncbi:hypothetical protein ColTof4_07355 [Colletotrichum tofieldiae]|nr:hypothetical protein ColTof4_07355 [Colletotrichum tofieldiae]
MDPDCMVELVQKSLTDGSPPGTASQVPPVLGSNGSKTSSNNDFLMSTYRKARKSTLSRTPRARPAPEVRTMTTTPSRHLRPGPAAEVVNLRDGPLVLDPRGWD